MEGGVGVGMGQGTWDTDTPGSLEWEMGPESTRRVKDGEPMRRRWELPEALQCLTAEQRVSAATIFQNMFAFIVRGSFYIL